MCPPVTDPVSDISIYCTDEEVFTSLDNMNPGYPLPGNVNTAVNPFCCDPQNLHEDIWYLPALKESHVTESGFWRPTGEPLGIFSNASIYGWKTTHEYYEGLAPGCCKTDWLIFEYKITTKGSDGGAKTKETRSLCKVCHNNGTLPDNGVEQTVDNKNDCIESSNHSQETDLLTTNKDSEKGSMRGELQVPNGLETVQNGEIDGKQEADYLDEGDYLEILDLDDPVSLSSDSSSCLSMSSGECFLALWQDLEAEDDRKLERRDADMRFNVSDSAQSLNIAFAADSVAALPVEESSLEQDPKDEKATSSKGSPSSSSPHAGSSSSSHSHNAGSSSSSCSANDVASSSRRPPSPDEKPKDRGSKRLKKLTRNLFCFLAF